MIVLEGVDATGVHPVLWLWLGRVSGMYRNWTAEGITVTSLRRPPGNRPSQHSPQPGELVTAADLRRWKLDQTHMADRFCLALQHVFGPDLGVVLEPEWLTAEQLADRGGLAAVAPHIHVQLKGTTWPDAL